MQARTAKLAVFALFVLSTGVAIVVWTSSTFEAPSKPVAFRDFMRDVDDHKIEEVAIVGQKVSGIYRASKEAFHTYAPAQYEGLADKLDAQGIVIGR